MACNAAACLFVSLISQRAEATVRRQSFHDFLRAHSALPPGLDYLRPLAWAVTLLWLFFAVGPGAVYGNWAFGPSSKGMQGWVVGIPPLWAWQMLWWALGVVMIWFLADRLGLSTQLSKRFRAAPALATARLGHRGPFEQRRAPMALDRPRARRARGLRQLAVRAACRVMTLGALAARAADYRSS